MPQISFEILRRKTRFGLKKINSNVVYPNKPKYYICPIPSSMNKPKTLYYPLFAIVSILMLSGCGILGKKNKGGSLPNDGQVHGISPGNKYVLPKPPGMVYIPQ